MPYVKNIPDADIVKAGRIIFETFYPPVDPRKRHPYRSLPGWDDLSFSVKWSYMQAGYRVLIMNKEK